MSDEYEISAEAMEAICTAADEKHSVFCLEQLGVPQRVINLLYDSGIRNMCELMSKSPEQLMAVQNFGRAHMDSIMRALSRYHKIEDI